MAFAKEANAFFLPQKAAHQSILLDWVAQKAVCGITISRMALMMKLSRDFFAAESRRASFQDIGVLFPEME
jgi:hypothetical protein